MAVSFRRLVSVLAMSAALLPSAAFAQEASDGLNLVTSPLPISLTADPGTTVSAPIKVKNGGTKPETIKARVMKFRAHESFGQPEILEPEHGDDFLSWVSFSEGAFTVAPGEWKTVTASFHVPQDAAFGYYYSIVLSRADEARPEEGKTVVTGGTAVLVLLDVRSPDTKRSVEVEEFSVDRKVYEFLPVTFRIRLKNTGNVHVAPRGNIFLDRGERHDIALLEINPGKGNILPGSSRVFEQSWADGFPRYEQKQQDGKAVLDERGNQVMELRWNWEDASKLRWGKHTAKMLLVYDDGQRDVPIEGEVSFWVVPWRLIAVGLVAGLLVLLGLKSATQGLWRKLSRPFVRG
jgi:hypothetical protein